VKASILVVDDDTRLTDMLAEFLRRRGSEVQVASTAAAGIEAVRSLRPDAVVLDVMLPDGDGFEVLRQIRSLPEPALAGVAVVMLTARGDEMDRIVGLELGADDYLPKPFNPRELSARVGAVLRRTVARSEAAEVLRFGGLVIDVGGREVRVGGEPRSLTSHQFEILVALARRAGRVLTRDQLMLAVRGERLEAFDRSIDVHMSRIRSAIEADPKKPKHIVTVRGVGYVFSTGS
jgi:DNA-binding response OmpR family regulator